MEKNEGTNYIDHRFPYRDMIKQVIVGRGWIATLDMYGDLLYLVIRDSIK